MSDNVITEFTRPFKQAESEVRPSSPGAGSSPLTRSQPRNEVGGRILGPVVATYEDIWEAYRQCRRLGREYSVTGHLDGWCIRRWITIEVPR